ncbi:purine-nucleoside phosphorylase [Butyrivibrio sp. DSM 10294]|uniref:purine-nucleoside phosphorylase n=1 Tax=Butyrivibrio sp. DSM 10294 TaxID=2972457 RepID=UPI00234E479A|nr:purine-nucleoside phosphorylase [Butyrivibrio sp. DSM 10294]MDC7293191.1 purine-nucleoside phosphorylase [Butyrivibrio sp. DSM 10294]
MSTPHNSAEKGDIAKTVLMPGDPLRAKFIAENFLTDIKCFNEVRGMLGFTGKYEGKEVSVMGHGMGIPSIGIYTYELYNFYDVDNIIRVGSAGGLQDKVNVMDIIFAQGAHTDSNYGFQFGLPGTFAPTASFDILEKAVAIAKEKGVRYHVGDVLSSDAFYKKCNESELYRNFGALAVEMETPALYMNAAEAGKKALTILTCSDHLFKNEELSAEERQTSFTDMMEIALKTAIQL